MNQLKEKVQQVIDTKKEELIQLSHEIHAHPEIAYEERISSQLICALLEKSGYHVSKGYGGLETAFYAQAVGKQSRPNIAILAEYDALKGIGHGCGHNIIATCAAGAFLGVASVIEELYGSVCILGTPAEEGGGGKITMLENGAFDDVDFAMMIHPTSGNNLILRGGRAAVSMKVAFQGKGAHSSDPSRGINALNALIEVFNGINVMRPLMPVGANVNGIITEGGVAANIIPDHTQGVFSIRGDTLRDLEKIIGILKDCVASAERLTGAKAEIKLGRCYAERYPNKPMGEAFKANIESLGEKVYYPDSKKQYGSSDIGNVSIRMPAIHEYLSIAPEGVNAHTKEFAECALSQRADEVCLHGAKGLAMTAIDLLTNANLRKQALDSHSLQVPEVYKK